MNKEKDDMIEIEKSVTKRNGNVTIEQKYLKVRTRTLKSAERVFNRNWKDE